MIQIYPRLTPSIRDEVVTFLVHADRSAPEHHPAWLEALRAGLGHQPQMLIDRSSPSADIRGILPLAWVRSRLFGRFLVSLPYLNRAGVLADGPDSEQRLIDAASRQARDGRADYLELRHADGLIEHQDLTQTRDDKPRLVLSLPDSDEALWSSLKSKVRNQVRKSERFDPLVRFGRAELLDAFYSVFAVTMRDLGTPVYPRRFFHGILDALPEHAELAVLTLDQVPVAGALLIHDPVHHRTTQVPSAACLRTANPTNANMALYRALLKRAIGRGATEFDFGRSTIDSGTYRFKTQWGAVAQPTAWQQMPLLGSTMAARPDNPKYRSRIETWRRLPVWVTRLIGPPIVRGIP
ncbi:MAG: FemAB family PEP-CTERM system-associated protein [Phycisphaeraceae bacterium]